jgi:hypothetical protein
MHGYCHSIIIIKETLKQKEEKIPCMPQQNVAHMLFSIEMQN